MLHHLVLSLTQHGDSWLRWAQFFGSFCALGTLLTGIINSLKWLDERKQKKREQKEQEQKSRVIIEPTGPEIRKYGQPLRKAGSTLMLIAGAFYMYLLLRSMRGGTTSGVPLAATIIFNALGILALVQGIFHPSTSGKSVLHRVVLSAAGIASVGVGTYVSVATGQIRKPVPGPVPEPSKVSLTVTNDTSSTLSLIMRDSHAEQLSPGQQRKFELPLGKYKLPVHYRCGSKNEEDTIDIDDRALEYTDDYYCGVKD